MLVFEYTLETLSLQVRIVRINRYLAYLPTLQGFNYFGCSVQHTGMYYIWTGTFSWDKILIVSLNWSPVQRYDSNRLAGMS